MDLGRLREETRLQHEATESLMPLTDPGLTLELYIGVLQLLLPLLRSWEQWALDAAPTQLRSLLPSRNRSHLIERDLHTLGASRAAAPFAPVCWAEVVTGAADVASLGPAGYEASFLGALYVFEGSTLGGRFIARHVEAALLLEPGHGDAYFQGHGEATGALWREVMAHLAAVPDQHAALVIGAARRAFTAFGDVLRAGLEPTPARLTRRVHPASNRE